MAVGLRSMRTGTTTSPAHARACCPGVVSSLKGRGFRLFARRSARKVGSCRSSGCRGQQRRRFTPTTVAASTSLSTEQRAAACRGEALCCDATLVSPLTRAGRPVPGADTRAGVALVAARRRKVARYPELTRGGPQRLVVRSPRCRSRGRWNDECQQLEPYSGSVSNAPHHPCAPLQPRAGRAAGGVCCRLPCSAPSPAPRLESGPCRRCLVRQTHSRWVTCWTSRWRAPRASCRFASTC